MKKRFCLCLYLGLCLALLCSPAAVAHVAVTANISNQPVTLDGKNVQIGAYNIANENYFRLRDFLAILQPANKNFAVVYDQQEQTLTIIADTKYVMAEGDLQPLSGGSQSAQANMHHLFLQKDDNREELRLNSYNIQGNNYYRLRDLAPALDLGVAYNFNNRTILIDSKNIDIKDIPADQNAGQTNPLTAPENIIAAFNQETSYDVAVFRHKFLQLLNEERVSHGLQPLIYNDKIQFAVDIRSGELADFGDISVNGQSHVRLDGSSFITVFNERPDEFPVVRHFAENLALTASTGLTDNYTDAALLAEEFFNIWKNSPPHYQNMMNPDAKSMAVSLKAGSKGTGQGKYKNSYRIIGTQILDLWAEHNYQESQKAQAGPQTLGDIVQTAKQRILQHDQSIVIYTQYDDYQAVLDTLFQDTEIARHISKLHVSWDPSGILTITPDYR